MKFDLILGKIWPFNRRTVPGADSLKIGIGYFKTIDLFDYAEFQETNSVDWWLLLAKVKDDVHMADFFSKLFLVTVL